MLKISVRGLDEVRQRIASLSKHAKIEAEKAVAEYLIGDQTHGLKHYPPYQYVSMQQVGGFKSDKQRRYVMANIRDGNIAPGVPHRTGELQRGWELKDTGTIRYIHNPTTYAKYVMGDADQSRMHGIIGWRTTMQNIQDNLKGAFRHAQAKLKEWFRAHR